MKIAIFLFDGCEELDWAGPWEVLASWAKLWPDDGAEVFTLAQRDGAVSCAKGLRVLADHTWVTAPHFDVLVYPGGFGTRKQVEDEEILDWVRARSQAGVLMTSVCTGSLVYAAAGLLKDRSATSHWGALDLLNQLDGSIDIRAGDRFVDVGKVVTAAGVSAGIDMALHLVGRLQSLERAAEVRRAIQYDPQPPV